MPEGSPVSVKVTVYVVATKFAVTVPAPLIVAVVDGLVADTTLIEEVEDQDENEYPAEGVALIERLPPELTHVLTPAAGAVVPPVLGLAATVTWN